MIGSQEQKYRRVAREDKIEEKETINIGSWFVRLHKYKKSSHILRRYLLKSDAWHDLNYCIISNMTTMELNDEAHLRHVCFVVYILVKVIRLRTYICLWMRNVYIMVFVYIGLYSVSKIVRHVFICFLMFLSVGQYFVALSTFHYSFSSLCRHNSEQSIIAFVLSDN